MNEARSEFQVVSCGKYLWAIGGEGTNGVLKTTEFYDVIINKWKKSTPMIEKRCPRCLRARGRTEAPPLPEANPGGGRAGGEAAGQPRRAANSETARASGTARSASRSREASCGGRRRRRASQRR